MSIRVRVGLKSSSVEITGNSGLDTRYEIAQGSELAAKDAVYGLGISAEEAAGLLRKGDGKALEFALPRFEEIFERLCEKLPAGYAAAEISVFIDSSAGAPPVLKRLAAEVFLRGK